MRVQITKSQTLILEGHITLTFRVGSVADLPDDMAKKGIAEGWCIAVGEAPGPDENAVAAPSETKRKRGS